jgi:hypothetical protein
MSLDLDAIKARLATDRPGPWAMNHIRRADLNALFAEVERLRAVLDSSSSALTEIAEDIRRDLWLDERDLRGHKFYCRIVDALPTLDGGEVSGG